MNSLAPAAALARTPLYELHETLGAKLVPFAGYEMPVQYPTGILAEHLHTRAKAGLFDVSHMGQARLRGPRAAEALETLVPGDLLSLAPARMRYTLLLNEAGGVLDDLMVTRLGGAVAGEGLFLVVNASRKEADFAHLARHLGADALEILEDRALLALQGPMAAAILARLAPGLDRLPFMSAAEAVIDGASCLVTRSGYTGEDGYEISVACAEASRLAELLLAQPDVAPVGLGARDSLRLEAGLCLYGHELDETTSPVEAGLNWTVGKRRRAEGSFIGAARILRELTDGPSRKRVGIRPDGKAPAREETEITDREGRPIGRVTSGGYGPSVGGPIAIGYVASGHAAPGSDVSLLVRGTPRPARIVPLPFVPARYYRG